MAKIKLAVHVRNIKEMDILSYLMIQDERLDPKSYLRNFEHAANYHPDDNITQNDLNVYVFSEHNGTGKYHAMQCHRTSTYINNKRILTLYEFIELEGKNKINYLKS